MALGKTRKRIRERKVVLFSCHQSKVFLYSHFLGIFLSPSLSLFSLLLSPHFSLSLFLHAFFPFHSLTIGHSHSQIILREIITMKKKYVTEWQEKYLLLPLKLESTRWMWRREERLERMNVRLERRGQKLGRERRTIEGRRESSVIFFFGSRAVVEEKVSFPFPIDRHFNFQREKCIETNPESNDVAAFFLPSFWWPTYFRQWKSEDW